MVRSNLGLLAMVALLIIASVQFSLLCVLCVYGMTYLVINIWLMTYTWLQHTNADIPHFANETWSWSKGSTADG